MSQQKVAAPQIDFNEPRLKRHRSLRALKDKAARVAIGTGGFTVIVAITMIFFYLLYEVAPLFQSASVDKVTEYQVPAAELGETLYLGMEEQAEKGIRVTRRSEEHTSELQSRPHLVCRLLLEKKKKTRITYLTKSRRVNRCCARLLSTSGTLVYCHRDKVTRGMTNTSF